MSKDEKLLKRFLARPKNFTYDELRKLLKSFGYVEDQQGKTSGSRVAFYNENTQHIIRLHKPHPGNELKMYQIDLIREELKERGLL
ncbi:MAG: type II toxin-antitoxin system HicA family toxin [Spirochaetaceae bacterium]|nr:type II toxin-antitoxin system HicA family toxin [Spirochaetaceae bacterium]